MKITQFPLGTTGQEEWQRSNPYEDMPLSLESWEAALPASARAVIYQYGTAPYEGFGHALIRFRCGGWAYAFLGHCSCYGPLDRLPRDPQAPTLDDLTKDWTTDALRERAAILSAARRRKARPRA